MTFGITTINDIKEEKTLLELNDRIDKTNIVQEHIKHYKMLILSCDKSEAIFSQPLKIIKGHLKDKYDEEKLTSWNIEMILGNIRKRKEYALLVLEIFGGK